MKVIEFINKWLSYRKMSVVMLLVLIYVNFSDAEAIIKMRAFDLWTFFVIMDKLEMLGKKMNPKIDDKEVKKYTGADK